MTASWLSTIYCCSSALPAVSSSLASQSRKKLSESSSPLTNPEFYAQYIYEQYLRRELISTGYEIINNAMKEDIDTTVNEQIEECLRKTSGMKVLFASISYTEGDTPDVEFYQV